jgi:hypothetical protein
LVKSGIVVLDGSFDKFQHSYFNYYNNNIKVKLNHSNITKLTTIANTIYFNDSIQSRVTEGGGAIVYSRMHPLNINIFKHISKNVKWNDILFYTSDINTPDATCRTSWYNTMYGGMELGQNLDTNSTLTNKNIKYKPKTQIETEGSALFVNGSIIQFSGESSYTKSEDDPNVTPPGGGNVASMVFGQTGTLKLTSSFAVEIGNDPFGNMIESISMDLDYNVLTITIVENKKRYPSKYAVNFTFNSAYTFRGQDSIFTRTPDPRADVVEFKFNEYMPFNMIKDPKIDANNGI